MSASPPWTKCPTRVAVAAHSNAFARTANAKRHAAWTSARSRGRNEVSPGCRIGDDQPGSAQRHPPARRKLWMKPAIILAVGLLTGCATPSASSHGIEGPVKLGQLAYV